MLTLTNVGKCKHLGQSLVNHSSVAITRNFERIPANRKQSTAKEIRDRISALSLVKIESDAHMLSVD